MPASHGLKSAHRGCTFYILGAVSDMGRLFEDLGLMPGYSATPAASGYRERLTGIDTLIVPRKMTALR
jgi:hypothetical protein